MVLSSGNNFLPLHRRSRSSEYRLYNIIKDRIMISRNNDKLKLSLIPCGVLFLLAYIQQQEKKKFANILFLTQRGRWGHGDYSSGRKDLDET